MDPPSPAGGRRHGGGEWGRLGPKDRSPCRTASRPPVSNHDLLRFWMVDIRREGRG